MLEREFYLVIRSAPTRYTAAVGLFILALLVRFWVLPVDATPAYITFYPAVVFAFYLCGIGPGLLAVALSAAAGIYIFTPPYWSWVMDRAGALNTLAFVISALLTAWVVRKLLRTSEQLSSTMQDLQASEERYKAVLEGQDDVVCRFDSQGGVVFANEACRRMSGLPADALVRASWQSVVVSEDLPAVLERLKTLGPGNPVVVTENRVNHAQRGQRWMEFVNRGFFDADGNLRELQTVGRDITLLKEQRERAEQIALHDALTGLPNRRLLSDRLQQTLSLCERLQSMLAVCFIDLDGFKTVNDALGHEAGDTVLKTMARRLQACVRGNDTVARLGGDEFVVLISPLQSQEECQAILRRVMAELCQPVRIGSRHSARVSASIGVAFYPEDSGVPAALLRRADEAMYQAKRSGRNQISYAASISDGGMVMQLNPRRTPTAAPRATAR